MSVSVTVRMDEDLKKQADDLFTTLGLSFSTAVNVFVRQAVRQQAIPFPIQATPTPQTDPLVAAAGRFMDTHQANFTRLAH